MAGIAVLVVRGLRHVPPTGGDTAPADEAETPAEISSVRR